MRRLKLIPALDFAREASGYISATDLAVYACIIAVGAFQATHYLHTADFVYDASYVDLARSLLQTGSYQLRQLPQTTLPPGFSLILAAVGFFGGFSPAALLPVIAVFSTAGLLVTYEFLHRVESRPLAAAACLLFASSPSLFGFITSFVYPELPYFFFSMVALLLALGIERCESTRSSMPRIVLLAVVLISAVLVRSVGIALLFALAAWIAVSLLVSPQLGRRRLARFWLPLLLSVCAQAGWSLWAHAHETLEWQLPGYPESYLSQVRMKDGHQPQSGMATPGDIAKRVFQNVFLTTVGFVRMLTRRYVSRFWASPAIVTVLLLVGVGLAASFRGGGSLHDWYFLVYEIIFALWPWNFTERFLFPVFPLVCLYLWRGAKEFRNLVEQESRVLGLCLSVLGSSLGLASAGFASGLLRFVHDAEHPRGDHLQPFAAIGFWLAVALLGVWLLMLSRRGPRSTKRGILHHLSILASGKALLAIRATAIAAFGLFVAVGTSQAMAIGRQNLFPDISRFSGYPMVQAAEWIRTHEPPGRVVFARDADFIFHYAGHPVVWFPPIPDPRILMDGIRKYRVSVILVMHHDQNYWLPSESTCFQALLSAYGSDFRLVHQGVDSRVYEVSSALADSPDVSLRRLPVALRLEPK